MQAKDSRILIVEDESLVALEISMSLENSGFKNVASLDSGEAAIKLFKEEQVDLVLMDIQLEGTLDGIKTAEIINNDFNTPVIFLTAYSDDTTLERAQNAYPSGYLTKPFKTKDLISNIKMVLYKNLKKNELEKIGAQFSVFLNQYCDGVLAIDTNGIVLFLNPKFVALTGWEKEDIINKNITDYILEKSGGNIHNLILDENGNLLDDYTKRLAWVKSVDGSRIPVDIRTLVVKSSPSILKGVILIFQKINRFRGTFETQESENNNSEIWLETCEKDNEFLKICPGCKKLQRQGLWVHIEDFIESAQNLDLMSCTCPSCLKNIIRDLSKILAKGTEYRSN